MSNRINVKLTIYKGLVMRSSSSVTRGGHELGGATRVLYIEKAIKRINPRLKWSDNSVFKCFFN